MIKTNVLRAACIVGATLALGACNEYYGGSVGYASDYPVYGGGPAYGGEVGYDATYDGYYGDPYGYRSVPYGYVGGGFGWFGDFYYPGTGYYVYDRGGHRRAWSSQQRVYWQQHGRGNRGDYRDGRRDDRGNGRGDYRDGRRDDRAAYNNGQGRPPGTPQNGYQGNRPPQNGYQGNQPQNGQGYGRGYGQGNRQDGRGDGRGYRQQPNGQPAPAMQGNVPVAAAQRPASQPYQAQRQQQRAERQQARTDRGEARHSDRGEDRRTQPQ